MGKRSREILILLSQRGTGGALDGGGFGVYNLFIAFSSEKFTAVANATEGDIMASKILIAEDDANILGLLSVFLSGLGYEVSLARDGQEALEMAVQIKPDLVIVDIMMPRMNGFKLVNTLAMDRHDIPMPKVIMLTSLADKENVQRGLSVGADVYIPKPFNLEDVAARVSELLGETPAK